ncbi:MAG TPA: hypothetical protein VFY68_04885 [Nitrososphaeraceae archaeon]|nr:hypothetical protein [Nitrososphaeraceae archaeon]
MVFIFSEENNLDFEQSVQDSFRFAFYSCISGNHTLSFLPLAGAIESFSKGLEILEELEEKTGYHHLLVIQSKEIFHKYKRKKEWGDKLQR